MEFDKDSIYRMWTQGVQALGQDRFPPEVWAKEYSYFIQCMRSGAEPSVKLTSDVQILKEYGVVVPNHIKPAARGGPHNFAQAQQPIKQQQQKQKPPNQRQQQQQQQHQQPLQQQLQLQRELQQQQQQHSQQLQQQRDLLLKQQQQREQQQQLFKQRQQQETPEQQVIDAKWQKALLKQLEEQQQLQQKQIQSFIPPIKQNQTLHQQKPHLQPLQLQKQLKHQQQQQHLANQQQQQQQHITKIQHQLPPKQPQLPVTKTLNAVKPNSDAIASVAPRVADSVFVKPMAPKENMIIAPKATVTRKRKDSIFDQIEHDIGDTERFFADLPTIGTPIAKVLTKPAVQSTGAASTSKLPQAAQNSEHRPSKHKKKKKH